MFLFEERAHFLTHRSVISLAVAVGVASVKKKDTWVEDKSHNVGCI